MKSITGLLCILLLALTQSTYAQNCVWKGQEYAPGETIENNNGCSGLLCASGGFIISWVADCSGGPEEIKRFSHNIPSEVDAMFASNQRKVNPFLDGKPSDATVNQKHEMATIQRKIHMLMRMLEDRK